MSSESDDDNINRYTSENYDIVGADLDWSIILASACSIFFGFLLKISVNSPSYFTFFDNVILLAALYAVTVATAMFIMPVIYHISNYRRLDVERFLSRTKQYVLIGIICILLAMYLALGLALNSKVPIPIAYSLASLPFIFIVIEFFNEPSSSSIKSSSTEHYDRMGASMRWSQILASASSIFFGFILSIIESPPSYFTFFDNVILLAALYAVTVATAMFIMPVIYHARSYRRLDVERFLSRTKKPIWIGIACISLAMYLILGLALNSKVPIPIAFIFASFPSIFIFYEFFRLRHKW